VIASSFEKIRQRGFKLFAVVAILKKLCLAESLLGRFFSASVLLANHENVFSLLWKGFHS
jgi:hypothetical protein